MEKEWLINAERQSSEIETAEVAFFKSLREKQEPLGEDFERVLFDNLWELYVRS